MFRHIVSHCGVIVLFMMATGTLLSANTVVNIDFEDPPNGPELDPVSTLVYPPLTIEFKSTNPADPDPYRGKYGDPGAGGWLCNQLSLQDWTIPPPLPGNVYFLSWVINDPINYDLEVRFSQPVDKVEGDIFDIDDVTEEFIITAYDVSGNIILSTMTVTPSSPPGGGDCGIQHWEVVGPGIRMVKFDGYKATPNLGFGVDNLVVTYDPATDCSITIIKETSPAGGTGFSFGSAFFPGFTLDDGQSWSFSGPHLCGPIYNLYEIPQPDWALTNIACVFTSGSGSFDIIGATVSPTSGFEPGDNEVVFHSLEPGSVLECTFTNSGCVPPPHGMRAWWTLDESSPSTSKDIRGFNNKGTWIGNPVPGAGMVAGGLCFNGSNFVEVLDHAELDFGDGDLSIDAWIYRENVSGIRPIVDKREANAEAHGYTLFLGNGILAFQLAVDSRTISACGPTLDNDCQNYSSGFSIPINEWTHVAVTVDRDDPNGGVFYVNGAEIFPHFDPTTQQGDISNTGNLWIGRRVPTLPAPSDRYFDGCIDEVELFNRVLLPQEVQSIFDAGSAGKCKTTSGAIPTLTEWGMIIFCALLFAWMAWVLVRRKKQSVQSC